MANLTVIAERLRKGETVSFRPHGHSMTPIIKDGREVTVRPLRDDDQLKKGMVVLAKVHGIMYLHLIKDVNIDRVLIGNAHGHMNGWTKRAKIYGVYIDSPG